MLVVGDISGIHDFVTNIASKGGGQTKRLRTVRSTFKPCAMSLLLRY